MKQSANRLPAVLLAVGGLCTSAVLEWVHVGTYLNVTADSFCSIGAALDCQSVALSRLAVLFGIPMPVWGFVGFLAMLVAALRRSMLLFPMTIFATLASVGLLVEELVHVGSVCLLCEVVHGLCLALLIVAFRQRCPTTKFNPDDAFAVLAFPAALLIVARVLVPPYWVFVLWTSGPPAPIGVTEDGHPWIGAENPTVVVEEWVDYNCPHCAIGANRMRMRLVQNTDTLRVVRRHQPRMRCMITNRASCGPLRAALCAEKQDKFWEMDSWLFAHAPGRGLTEFQDAYDEVGLDGPTFEACLYSDEILARAREMAKEATIKKILDTPTYFIEGKRFRGKAAIEQIEDRL